MVRSDAKSQKSAVGRTLVGLGCRPSPPHRNVSPLGDDPPWNVEDLSDMLVIVTIGSQQDDLRSDHFVVRYRVLRGVVK